MLGWQRLDLAMQAFAQLAERGVADARFAQLLKRALQREPVRGLGNAQHLRRVREIQAADQAQQQRRPRTGAQVGELGLRGLAGRQFGLGEKQRPEARRPARQGGDRGHRPERPHGPAHRGQGFLVAPRLDLGEDEGAAFDAAQERRKGWGGGRGSRHRGVGNHPPF